VRYQVELRPSLRHTLGKRNIGRGIFYS
jgi:hypothetical protein